MAKLKNVRSIDYLITIRWSGSLRVLYKPMVGVVAQVVLRILLSFLFRGRGFYKYYLFKEVKNNYRFLFYLSCFLTYLLLFEGFQAKSTPKFVFHISYIQRFFGYPYLLLFEGSQVELNSTIVFRISLYRIHHFIAFSYLLLF